MLNSKEILKNSNIKSTAPRIAVLEAFLSNKKPVAAQEIYNRIKKHQIDLVTVYRTITSFEKAGIIKRIDVRKDSIFYELNGTHHHHIVCTRCGDMEDFEQCEMDTLVKKIIHKSKIFSSINEHNFELFGLCNSCAK